MSSEPNWPALIDRHVLVQQRIRELDREGLWNHELPAVGATPAELLASLTAYAERKSLAWPVSEQLSGKR